eukprot:jgi/Chlat1/3375/Chrsp23S03807
MAAAAAAAATSARHVVTGCCCYWRRRPHQALAATNAESTTTSSTSSSSSLLCLSRPLSLKANLRLPRARRRTRRRSSSSSSSSRVHSHTNDTSSGGTDPHRHRHNDAVGDCMQGASLLSPSPSGQDRAGEEIAGSVVQNSSVGESVGGLREDEDNGTNGVGNDDHGGGTRFEYRHSNPTGTLVVRSLTKDLLEPTAELLANSFADTMGLVYRPFLRRTVREYLAERMELNPDAVCLTGLLYASVDRPPVLVGTVEVSFTDKTRPAFLTLNPPNDATYLCNMAVAPEFRRRGLGRQLLFAAEALVLHMRRAEVYLHVRIVDKPAARLYATTGYQPVCTDGLLSLLLLQRRRVLMRKHIHLTQ